MSVIAVFRLLLVVACVADLIAWTWRDVVFTRALHPEIARGDTNLLITAVAFALFAIPLWRRWRWSGVLMAVLTVLAVVDRVTRATVPHTTTDGITILEIIAATAWGVMLAIIFLPTTRDLFDQPLLGRSSARDVKIDGATR